MKLIFEYSYIYDTHWKEFMCTLRKTSNYRLYKFSYPKEQVISKYVKRLNNDDSLWSGKEGERCLKMIESITGLRWKEKTIKCYIVGNCIPISVPLTVFMTYDHSKFFDNILHELIHIILSSNYLKLKRFWSELEKIYGVREGEFSVHIPLYAIQFKVLKETFGEGAVLAEAKRGSSINKNYKKAIDIALRDEDKILEMLRD